jgi:hypothetical protein
VLVADDRRKADVPRPSKHLSSNIRTARVVAKIFSHQFFAPVWSGEARLDRYLWNGKPLTKYRMLGAGCTSDFLVSHERCVYSR